MMYENVSGKLPEEILEDLRKIKPKSAEITLFSDHLGPVTFATNEKDNEQYISGRHNQEDDRLTRVVRRSLVYQAVPKIREIAFRKGEYTPFDITLEISGIVGGEPVICWNEEEDVLTEIIFRARVTRGEGERMYSPQFIPDKIRQGGIGQFVEETYFLFPGAAGMRSFAR